MWSVAPLLGDSIDGLGNRSSNDNGEAVGTVGTNTESNCIVFNFVFNALIIGFLCVMIVLQKASSSRVAAFLLQFLMIADSILLISSFVVFGIFLGWGPNIGGGARSSFAKAQPYFVKYFQPFGYIAQSMTIWATVLLATNRYIAVCCPFVAYKL